MHIAVLEGQFNAVQILQRHGADLFTQTKRLETILHYSATTKGNGSLYIRFLVDSGLELDDQDQDGNTPLMRAALRGIEKNYRVIKVLLELGASPNVQNKQSKCFTSLFAASDIMNPSYKEELNSLLLKASASSKKISLQQLAEAEGVIKRKGAKEEEKRELGRDGKPAYQPVGRKQQQEQAPGLDFYGKVLMTAFFVFPIMMLLGIKLYETELRNYFGE